MRKVLVIALGLASLAGAQPAFAGCVQVALDQCHLSGDKCTTGNQYLSLYWKCLNDPQGTKTFVNEQKQQQRAANPGPGATARNINTPSNGSTARHSQ